MEERRAGDPFLGGIGEARISALHRLVEFRIHRPLRRQRKFISNYSSQSGDRRPITLSLESAPGPVRSPYRTAGCPVDAFANRHKKLNRPFLRPRVCRSGAVALARSAQYLST